MKYDGIAQPVGFDAGHEVAEFSALDQRKNIGERMEFERHMVPAGSDALASRSRLAFDAASALSATD